jgi:CheY-like chemotaxis protein
MVWILIIEDNELNQDLLSRRLTRCGFDVEVSNDAESGLAKARAGHPDLILMDLNLPGLDGWEATRILKSEQDTRGIPVIALTAHAMLSDREKAIQAGCNEYESKPIEFAKLLRKIETLLRNTNQETAV